MLQAKAPVVDPVTLVLERYEWWAALVGVLAVAGIVYWLMSRRVRLRSLFILGISSALFFSTINLLLLTWLWGFESDPVTDFFFSPIAALSGFVLTLATVEAALDWASRRGRQFGWRRRALVKR
jgi:hypothetical protein